jgi:hypothetical protein
MTSRVRNISLLSATALGLLLPAGLAEAECPPGATFCAEAHVEVGGSVRIDHDGRHDRVHERRRERAERRRERAEERRERARERRERARERRRERAEHRHNRRHARRRGRRVEVRVDPPHPRRHVVVVERRGAPEPPPQPRQRGHHPPRTPGHTVTVEHESKVHYAQGPQLDRPNLGVHGHVGGITSSQVDMGGFTAAFRLRPQEHIGLDLGIGAYGGTDYNGLDRAELPVTADLLFFVNPQHPLQVYFVAGAGVSFAHAEGVNRHTGHRESRDFTYAGGQAGVGLEWRIADHFALNTDLRGFLRKMVDSGNGQAEFVEYDDGRRTGRTTNLSGGGVFNLGATVYF